MTVKKITTCEKNRYDLRCPVCNKFISKDSIDAVETGRYLYPLAHKACWQEFTTMQETLSDDFGVYID